LGADELAALRFLGQCLSRELLHLPQLHFQGPAGEGEVARQIKGSADGQEQEPQVDGELPGQVVLAPQSEDVAGRKEVYQSNEKNSEPDKPDAGLPLPDSPPQHAQHVEGGNEVEGVHEGPNREGGVTNPG
jgi:hypothetical protein